MTLIPLAKARYPALLPQRAFTSRASSAVSRSTRLPSQTPRFRVVVDGQPSGAVQGSADQRCTLREVRAASLTGFVEVSYYLRIDPYDMLRRAKISTRFLDDPENRHEALPVIEMLEDAAERSQCESFGLLMADCRSFSSLGPLSLLLERLPTVGDVLDALNEYRRLMTDVASLECIRGEESSVFCWIVAPGFERTQATDLAVGAGYRILTEALGGRWAPEAVHLTRPAVSNPIQFHQFFSAPIEFDAKFSGYSCATASLETGLQTADPAMAAHARRLLELIPSDDQFAPVSEAARRAIALLLPTGGGRLADVAPNLGMDARTLERRLALEGASFEALVNDTRKDVAGRFLIASEQPVGSIARVSGYSSTAAFRRWFASEFGKSPSAWRREMRDFART
jgi:AraC-like DNA-binding protein